MVLVWITMLVSATVKADEHAAAAWGDDHVGQPFPAYMTGDECLFCHRDIGTTWADNRHQLTIRFPQADDQTLRSLEEHQSDVAAEVQLLMGSRRITRFLKRSDQYGRLDIHTTAMRPDKVDDTDPDPISISPTDHWETTTFADRCAGCHTTAVDTSTRAFSAVSLDCFTCHGDVPTEHTEKTSNALLSTQNKPPRHVVSLCGQCHLRGGASTSSGLPFPNTFVPGDNLFRDFQVDFSQQAMATLATIDQHIFRNTYDVAVRADATIDCLTCHDVHPSSSDKHKELEASEICSTCHVPGTNNSKIHDAIRPAGRLSGHSRVCDY
jgi:predicted CXXCH cytochrome family protein